MNSPAHLTIDCDLAPTPEDVAAARAGLMEFNDSQAVYEKRGYVVFGVLEGYPANTRTYCLQKAL